MNDAVRLAASRILVIDDNQAIHQDFRKIFGTSQERATPSAAEQALFGGDDGLSSGPGFQVDSAYQGQEGLALVRLALEQHNPYAVAFVDVRMPPGWDGVETVARIWEHDADIQIVICTAYSDYSWSEMLDKLGRTDRLVILKKPFDTIEVVQLASALTEKWRLARQSRSILEGLEHKVAERTHELVQKADEFRRSERLKGAILESSLDCVVTIDHEGRIVEFNPAAELTFGFAREMILGKEMVDLIVPPRLRDGHRRGFASYLATGKGTILGKRIELAAVRRDGTEFPIELAITAIGGTPKPMFTGFIRDITARNEANARIERLNRVYAVLSGINMLIVRVSAREELFRESCRIAVELGGFRMSWIGIVDKSRMELRPVASAGTTSDFHALVNQRFSLLEEEPRGNTLAARAIRDKVAAVSNDVRSDPRIVFRDEHAARGSLSMVILPLVIHGDVAGLLTLYSGEAGFFDDEEMKLLTELAGDVAFAVDHIERAAKLARLTRVNAMLSDINRAIVRIRDRRELFEETCRIAVETGGMPFAWMSMVDDKEMRLRPVASAGNGGNLLELIQNRLWLHDKAPQGYGMGATAVRERRPVIVSNVEIGAAVMHKKEYADLGIKSAAALPLLVAGKAVGSFTLNAREADFFDDDEMKLFNEVAANIAFALESIDKEAKVRRLTRVNAVLSGINALIVRARDREELFSESCRIAVEQGRFKMAWIGVVNRSAMKIEPVASAGSKPEYLAHIKDSFLLVEDPTMGLTMTSRAVLGKKALFSNDTQNDPDIKFKQEHVEAGTRSLASVPLLISDEAVGVICLYTEEAGFFDAEELALLVELAGNIAFAVDHIDKAGKLGRMTRVNAMLSDTNGAIVRIRNRKDLFDEACRIAVETGSLPFAWLGVVNASETELQVVASAGRDDGFLQTIRERLALRGDTPDSESLSWRAVREQRTVVVNDVATDTVLRSRKAFAERGIRSAAVFPLLVAGRVAGAFALHSDQPGFFDDDEIHLLNEVAANISFALEYMEREEKVRRLTRVNAMLSGINAAIVRIRDRQELFEESCRIAFEVGGLPFVWLGIVDEQEQRLRLRASAGGDPVFIATMGDRLSLRDDAPAGHGTGSRSVREKRPVAMNDAEADAYQKYRKTYAEHGIKSVAAFPLIIAGRVVGTFALHAAEAGFFDEDEMRLLGEVTSNIAFALDHIKKAQKLARLTRINAILSGINGAIVQMRDRKRLFQEVCRIAVETGGLPFAWLCIVDDTGEKLLPVGYAGPDDGFLEMIVDRLSLLDDAPNGHGISARSVREERTIRVGDVAAGANIMHKKPYADRGIRSSAAFPLFIGGRVIGSFSLNAAEVNFFDDEETKLLEEVARNIAFALEHIEKEEKVERLTRVYAVSSGITSLIVHVDSREELFREACRIAVEEGKFAMAWIGAFDPVTQDVTPEAWAGEAAEELTRAKSSALADNPRGAGAVGQSIRARRPIFNNDIRTQAFVGPRLKEILRLGFESHITLPLYEAQEIVATLTLYTKERGFFDEAEVRLLTELAADISFALENISRQHKLTRMTRMNAVLSGINALIVRANSRDELFKESCRIAIDAGAFSKCWIGTIEPESRRFRIAAAHGGDPEFFPTLEAQLVTKVLAGQGLVARAAATLQPVVTNDAVNDPDVLLKDDLRASGVRSAAVLPLVVAGAAVGVLVLNSDVRGFFDDEEMALLAELARNIAFAVGHIGRQDKLDYFAYYDALTGLANRTLFLERLTQYKRSAIAGGHKLALFVLDLERFRNINESLGRPAGDAILKQVADWLTLNVGDASLLAHLGSDQFAIVLPELTQQGDLPKLLDKRIRQFNEHTFRIDKTELRINMRVGVALFPSDGTDADALLRNAEAALKNAKERGDRVLFYNLKMTEAVAGKLTLENQLRRALDNEEFVLHYQPKINLESGKLTSAEALIRWNDPQTGLVPPGKFIPILEETGLIQDVGRWALRKAISDYLRWRAAGLPAVRIAVNVSPLQLRNRGFSVEIQQLIGIDPLAAGGLELEITESVIMEDVKSSIASLQAIRDMGVTIAIDDFGTGFSSLSHLARLPVDTLKIDRSFVINMTSDAQGLSLVSTIINLAHSLKLKVVAEGVETEEQSRLLRLLRCNEMQGFLFSKPVPAEVFEAKFLALPVKADAV